MPEQPYIVSARKYRPATFRTVVGQKSLTATLKNAIDTRRLAQAYLFCGPRGVGKTSCARIFAKTINCLSPTADGEACGVCDSCVAMEKGNSLNVVELDAASNNSVDDIRSITEQVNVPPQTGKYRVFIIDEVHMLSSAAFNAFLKTLEEPPSYVIFILATTEKHKVIPTILSRCQIYDFKRITVNDMVEHLEYVAQSEGIKADRRALGVIALKADGAMRDALSIFDQVAASSMGDITYESAIANLNVLDYDYYFRLVDAFRASDVPSSLLIYKEILDKGFDSLFFVNGLAAHVRDLMVSADPRTASLLETSEDIAARYLEQARSLPLQWYYAAMKLLNDCDFAYRTATSKRLLVELTLIRICQLLKPATPPFDAVDAKPLLLDPTQGRPGPAPTADTGRNDNAVATAPQQPASQPAAPQPTAPQSTAPRPPVSAPSREPGDAPRSTRTVRHAGAGRPTTLRLTELKEETQTQSSAHSTTLRQPFTSENLLAAWGDFIAANPTQHILVNAMRASTPQRVTEEAYRIVVDHPAQQQAFESAMPRLLEFMRRRVKNDMLTLRVEINDTPVEARQLLPQEFLRQTIEGNPSLAKLLSDLDAELC